MQTNRLLVLAIDAASAPLLRSWASDGTLPNIAALMADGLVGDTRNVEGLYVGATWPSFSTGLNPGAHGVYWIDVVKPHAYEMGRCTAEDLARQKTLWEVLGDAGRRVMVLDVPLSRLSPGLNGQQVVEWGTHDPLFGFQASSRRLRRRLLDSVGAHPAPRICDVPHRTPAEYRRFTDQLIAGAALRARWTRELLQEEPWDFAIQVFSEAHCAGHQLWHMHDTAHPGFDPEAARDGGDPVREVYRAIDAAIGEVVRAQDAGTTIVLLALHGMTRMFGYHYLTPEILLRLGVMARASSAAPGTGGGGRPAGFLRRTYRRLPERLRRPLYDLRQHILQRGLGHGVPFDLDPERSRCFDVGLGPTVSAIRFNLKGREPSGTLTPGEEADRFAEELGRSFLELVDPDTGQPLVRRVMRSAEHFHGPWLEELPDLLIEWDEAPAVGSTTVGTGRGAVLRAHSERLGSLEYLNTYGRSGDHQIGGMFIARGPGIAPGVMGRTVSTLDLAPTFARMLGAAMQNVDGAPIGELLDSRAPTP
ncbi:MAG TPA: alkaline phosphatase family protein [Gemmatimonadales bacterium]